MRRPSLRLLVLLVPFALAVATPARAQPLTGEDTYEAKVEPASDEAERAIAKFRAPDGVRVELFAAEPLLANPVAFDFDAQGRLFVVETFRLHQGVTDIRGHMDWLDDDLASRTVADRVAMYRKHLKQDFATYAVHPDRIRRLVDTDDDGRMDAANVFVTGFSKAEDGLAAGVLVRGQDVWYTDIPDLWHFRDADGDGVADVSEALSSGYGVHVGFLGHDLHGLVMGPDGRLYFSIGDRGLNVKAKDGREVRSIDTGAVLRCEPDGSDLEVFAIGLRNPQELAFNELGDLFTVDNNSDGGDQARVVHLVRGGDSGWRIGYQFLEFPTSRGTWNTESLWKPLPENTGSYLLPPLLNLSDGPSGLAHDPGVTLLPDRLRGRFYLADFRGSSGNSGVRSFTLKPRGASYEVDQHDQFLWSILATDVGFGPDGALYVADWVEGWNLTGKGRIYRLSDPEKADAEGPKEVSRLLAEGFDERPNAELATLLGHGDMRIRLEAQYALARRGPAAVGVLANVAAGDRPQLARLHAVWGLGQVARKAGGPTEWATPTFQRLLKSKDAEVRAQAAKVVGELKLDALADELLAHLGDDSPRVRFQAALALGAMGRHESVAAALELLRESDDRDPYLRHAAVMALAGSEDVPGLVAAAADHSPAVRLGALLALRRLGSPEVARFLNDRDPRIVLEASRAIYDEPIAPALPPLAAMLERKGLATPVLRRALNAAGRVGTEEAARALAALATSDEAPETVRVEALEVLADWASPRGRDRVVGLWRPQEPRPADPAKAALADAAGNLLETAPDPIREAAAKAAGTLAITTAAPALLAIAGSDDRSADARIAALQALGRLGDDRLTGLLRDILGKKTDSRVRGEALGMLAKLEPAEAIPVIEVVLKDGAAPERQRAFAALADLPGDAADDLLAGWLERLKAGEVAPEVQLDLIEAAETRPAESVKQRLAEYQASLPADDPLAPYRVALAGGDFRRGFRIFREDAQVACLRCHKVFGDGGEVGPELTGIGDKKDRQYLLESIVLPDKQIAEGFETQVLALADGRVVAGIVKEETDEAITLITPEARVLTIPRDDIDEQKRGPSAMPQDIITHLDRSQVRDLIEFLARARPFGRRGPSATPEGHGTGEP